MTAVVTHTGPNIQHIFVIYYYYVTPLVQLIHRLITGPIPPTLFGSTPLFTILLTTILTSDFHFLYGTLTTDVLIRI